MVRGQLPIVRGVLAGELTESEAALRVYAAAAGLLLLGVLLLVFTVRWWRDTRPDPPSLGPLDVMGDRRWSNARDADRRRLLDEHRPTGADPSIPLIVEPEPIDLSVLARDTPKNFDDLREEGPVSDPAAVAVEPFDATMAADRGELEEVIEREIEPVEIEPVEGDLVEDELVEDDLVDDELVDVEPTDNDLVQQVAPRD